MPNLVRIDLYLNEVMQKLNLKWDILNTFLLYTFIIFLLLHALYVIPSSSFQKSLPYEKMLSDLQTGVQVVFVSSVWKLNLQLGGLQNLWVIHG